MHKIFTIFIILSFCIALSYVGNSKAGEVTQPSKSPESKAEKEERNPILDYKLIAIYKIENQKRALIFNEALPDDGAKEYREGDYLDDLQYFSVHKIVINPTVKIEIIDKDGLSYLIRPHSVDVKSLSGGSAGTRSIPSQFSTGGTSSKKPPSSKRPLTDTDEAKAPKEKEESTTPPPPQAASETKSTEASQETKEPSAGADGAIQAAGKTTAGSSATDTSSQKSGTASEVAPPSRQTNQPAGDDLQSRPSNPF